LVLLLIFLKILQPAVKVAALLSFLVNFLACKDKEGEMRPNVNPGLKKFYGGLNNQCQQGLP
jgi:hypothetical protein